MVGGRDIPLTEGSRCLHCGEPVENLLALPYCSVECAIDHNDLLGAIRCDWCDRVIDEPNELHPYECNQCHDAHIEAQELLRDPGDDFMIRGIL